MLARSRIRLLVALVVAALALARDSAAQSYTIAPTPFQTALNNSGAIINNACIWTYQAGTTTAIATYSDNAGTSNTNPIRTDSAGRFTAYLLAGTSYKFVYETSCTPPAHGTTLRTADNIVGVPAAAANVDLTGTAGETINAGNCVYLSDGSGSKTVGLWYKCDSGNPYSSTTAEVGIAPSAIANAASGTIRISGVATGLSSLAVGSEYFVGTSGAVTSTAPALRRHLGHADTATTIVLTGDPGPTVVAANLSRCALRLTLESGVPVSTTDQTAKTSVFVTPVDGGQCAFYDGTATWTEIAGTEQTISVPATTSTIYDVWCRLNGNALACDTTAWTNDTTRATALTTQSGVRVKTGDTTRRYIGTFRTTTVSGQTEDSAAKRYVWSYYNRVVRGLRVADATASWTYTTATWRQANAAAANQLDLVVGIAEDTLDVTVTTATSNGTAAWANVGIGEDSTSAPVSGATGSVQNFGAASFVFQLSASLSKAPAVGRHTYVWLEASQAAGTTTFYGTNSTVGGNAQTSAIVGRFRN